MSYPQQELSSMWSVNRTEETFVSKTPGALSVEPWKPWTPDKWNTSKGFISSGELCSIGPVVLTPGVVMMPGGYECPRLSVTGVRKWDGARGDYDLLEGGHKVTFNYDGGNNPILCHKCATIGDVPPLRSSDTFEMRHENIVTVGSVVTVELVVTTYQVMLVVTNLDPGYADLVVSR